MNKTLYLLRHAKAESWNPLGNDFSRALAPKGTAHARAVADWFNERVTPPDTVLCSPAKRTRETLAPILDLWPSLLSTTDYIDSIYGASTHMLNTITGDAFSYSDSLLMVGHNPGFEDLLLSSIKPEQGSKINKMATGTLAIIEFPDGFRGDAQVGNLLHLIRRKDSNVSD